MCGIAAKWSTEHAKWRQARSLAFSRAGIAPGHFDASFETIATAATLDGTCSEPRLGDLRLFPEQPQNDVFCCHGLHIGNSKRLEMRGAATDFRFFVVAQLSEVTLGL